MISKKKDGCVFCHIEKGMRVFDSKYWYVIYDKYPVNEGHMLLISQRHVESYFDLREEESSRINNYIHYMKSKIEEKYDPDGYNIGINVGEVAGQTVDHLHIHLIPRYEGDIDNPEGGVRGVIPDKRMYRK